MAKNPYEILGVSKTADDAEIKTAYRKLAKKLHPDLNPGLKGNDEQFKELNTANALLSDKEKRAAFDRGEIDMEGHPQYQQQQKQTYRDYAQGAEGGRYNFGGGDFNFEDIFAGFGGGAGFGGRQSSDVNYTIEIDFLEAALGAKKRVTMPDGKSIEISIPVGINEGQKLRLKGQGSNPSGDAYVEIKISEHKLFSRNGNNISMELPVSLKEIVLGGKIKVPTIQGSVEMTIPKASSNGATLRLKEKGIKGGDQFVKLKLVMPKEIDADLVEAIRNWAEKHSYNPRQEMESSS